MQHAVAEDRDGTADGEEDPRLGLPSKSDDGSHAVLPVCRQPGTAQLASRGKGAARAGSAAALPRGGTGPPSTDVGFDPTRRDSVGSLPASGQVLLLPLPRWGNRRHDDGHNPAGTM